jgi:pimeloyl-ACP methyl ester carboxylesterase
VSRYVLVPGAGGVAWYWHRVVPLLERAGHGAVAVDLPGEDDAAGLPEYAAIVRAAIGAGGDDVVLVAQSLGGFVAPMVATVVPVRAVVLVNAMIPVPGETPGQWWENTGSGPARLAAAARHGYPADFDLETYFLHDVPPDVVAAGENLQHAEGDRVFETPCAITAWPAVPVRVVAGAGDRFFPVEFQQALARERLGVQADVLPGGHLLALSHPDELARYLLVV